MSGTAADTTNPLTFTLKDFERIIALWDCKLNQSSFDADGNLVLPSTCRIVTLTSGKKMVIQVAEKAMQAFREQYGDRATTHIIEAALDMVRLSLNGIGLYGPDAKQSLAMIRMFDALEAVYPQTDLLARDAEMPEFMDEFKWGLAAGVAVGLVLDDPEILEE
ncbi:hypothetical protein LCGC14_0163440 [marine sediment metagenome]|uniref:Uncharacterized protein n=1 Tax=marine sediment metagenome TaxID=412755 RepID=A0A0F9UUD8_9ZZZZ